jgi:hypothetical protein
MADPETPARVLEHPDVRKPEGHRDRRTVMRSPLPGLRDNHGDLAATPRS